MFFCSDSQRWGIPVEPKFAIFGQEQSLCARIILALVAPLLLFRILCSDAAATPVPRELYGKSVTRSSTGIQVFADETTGRNINLNWERTDSFYFSYEGRIFSRYNNRNAFGSMTFEQVGRGPNGVQRPISATGAALKAIGIPLGHFQDIHFEGRTLVGIQKWGTNGAIRITIEFDKSFTSCIYRGKTGTDDGQQVRRIGWSGHVERVISNTVTSRSDCVIRDGNVFEK